MATSLPSALSLSVSDPVSAMVIACLTFLGTPAGQQLAINFNNDMGTIIVNLFKFVHVSLPGPDILNASPGTLAKTVSPTVPKAA